MNGDYKADLTRANEYRPDCAYHPGTPAVVVVKVDGVNRDVCASCWKKLRTR